MSYTIKYNKGDFTCARIKGMLNLEQAIVKQAAKRKAEVLTVYSLPLDITDSSYSQHISLPRGGKRGQCQRQAGTHTRSAACPAHTEQAAHRSLAGHRVWVKCALFTQLFNEIQLGKKRLKLMLAMVEGLD